MLSPIRDTQISPLVQQPKLNGLGSVPAIQSAPDNKPVPAVPLSRHRLLCYERWERLSRQHRRLVYAQVMEGELIQHWRRARRLEKRIQQSLERQVVVHIKEMAQLQHQMISRRTSFSRHPLLDHRLQPQGDGGISSPRLCTLKSVDLLSPRPREELIEIRLADQWLSFTLPEKASVAHQLMAVQTAFSACGVETSEVDGVLHFSVPEALWQKLDAHLWMRGQGQRLPAGELRGIKLVELYHWQDPRGWELGDLSNLRKVLPKVQGVASRLARSVAQIRNEIEFASAELMSRGGRVTPDDVVSQLQAVESLMVPHNFQHRLKSLVAQANSSRNQTLSLLC